MSGSTTGIIVIVVVVVLGLALWLTLMARRTTPGPRTGLPTPPCMTCSGSSTSTTCRAILSLTPRPAFVT